MLRCTDSAANVVELLRDHEGVPDDFGLRLYPDPGSNGEAGIRIGFRATPDDGDEVTEQNGLRLFIAAEVAPQLASMELDATADMDGSPLTLRPARTD